METTEKEKREQKEFFWNLGLQTIKELETDEGILASSRDELFGAIFGRDSSITAIKLLKVYKIKSDLYFLRLVRKILLGLARLQGKSVNIESGEEPGKCIHEYRPTNHERLSKLSVRPWYIYPDGKLRNYDSVDSTPLFLIACYRYFQLSKDYKFLSEVLPSIELGLEWLLDCGARGKSGVIKCIERDEDSDIFVDYEMPPQRKHGGLTTQSWMDSEASVFHEDGREVARPINPIEVQAYTFLAYRLWANYFKEVNPDKGSLLNERANRLKEQFNNQFITKKDSKVIIPFAIDGRGEPLVSARSTMGHCFWASLNPADDQIKETIFSEENLPLVLERIFRSDLFEPKAGVRTLSTESRRFSANSYHNGSIWPHDTGIIAEGLQDLGLIEDSQRLKEALLQAFWHFKTPLELFVFDKNYKEYEEGSGATSKQAWSAATMLWLSADSV